MLYFRHSELVDKYHFSLKTVHNWIDAAKQGKLDIELTEANGRTYIANSPDNIRTLNNLAAKGKKYRNVRFQKVVEPNPEFYELFSRRQTLDIISNLNIHHEIPRQYNYFNGGANHWDNLVKKQAKDQGPNNFSNTVSLLHSNLDSIRQLFGSHTRINVIDLGVGNAMPSRELLEYLLKHDLLHRYIAIDISPSMLEIARENVDKWFDGAVTFEGHIRDVTHQRFDDLLLDDMLDGEADNTLNLVLLMGGTPLNFRSFPDLMKVIYGSMGERDLLLYTGKPDTIEARRHFNAYEGADGKSLSPLYRFMLDLLNIDKTLYDIEMGYDDASRMRYVRVRLRAAVTINFRYKRLKRSVTFEKGDAILLLRVWHMTALETVAEFEKAGYVLLQSNMTKDRSRLLTILGVDTDGN
jgi:SAM-dependent methyltransferase